MSLSNRVRPRWGAGQEYRNPGRVALIENAIERGEGEF
jgi:hypothetical protein